MKKIKFFGLGALFGAIAGLLLAPKSGKDIRRDLKELGEKIIEEAEAEAVKIENLTQEKYNEIVFRAAEMYRRAERIKEEDMPLIIDDIQARWVQIEKKWKGEKEKKSQDSGKKTE